MLAAVDFLRSPVAIVLCEHDTKITTHRALLLHCPQDYPDSCDYLILQLMLQCLRRETEQLRGKESLTCAFFFILGSSSNKVPIQAGTKNTQAQVFSASFLVPCLLLV